MKPICRSGAVNKAWPEVRGTDIQPQQNVQMQYTQGMQVANRPIYMMAPTGAYLARIGNEGRRAAQSVEVVSHDVKSSCSYEGGHMANSTTRSTGRRKICSGRISSSISQYTMGEEYRLLATGIPLRL